MGGAWASRTVPVSASADQNMGLSVALNEGRTKKLQPPATPRSIRHGLSLACRTRDCHIVALVVFIAPQPFPGEIGSNEVVDVVVGW